MSRTKELAEEAGFTYEQVMAAQKGEVIQAPQAPQEVEEVEETNENN